jgi:hypothetical protein
MRDGKKPELLKDKINYQVMGANEWKHAPSLEKMGNEILTLYLTAAKVSDHYQLSKEKPSKPEFLHQEVDFADRKTRFCHDLGFSSRFRDLRLRGFRVFPYHGAGDGEHDFLYGLQGMDPAGNIYNR